MDELYKMPGWVNPEGYTLEQALQSVGKGWAPLINHIFSEKPDDVHIVQVKEKFGRLRVYANDANFEDTVIDEAQKQSASICEWCGQAGDLDIRYWWVLTLCKECKVKRKKQMDKKGISVKVIA